MAHALLSFPVLFAASQMRTPVAAGITAVAVVADAITLVMIEPVSMALIH